MTEKMNQYSYGKAQQFWLVTLRVIIGWYFHYEGVAKVMTPGWTSYGYLMDSQGWFASLFKALAQNQALMPVVDALNIYGLILIGLSLVLGCFEKIGYIGVPFYCWRFTIFHILPASMPNTYFLLKDPICG